MRRRGEPAQLLDAPQQHAPIADGPILDPSWTVGQLTLEAISQRDYPVIQAAVLLAGAIYLGANLLVDVLYGLLDPRIRLEGRA